MAGIEGRRKGEMGWGGGGGGWEGSEARKKGGQSWDVEREDRGDPNSFESFNTITDTAVSW